MYANNTDANSVTVVCEVDVWRVISHKIKAHGDLFFDRIPSVDQLASFLAQENKDKDGQHETDKAAKESLFLALSLERKLSNLFTVQIKAKHNFLYPIHL
jgi:hypothetical protein